MDHSNCGTNLHFLYHALGVVDGAVLLIRALLHAASTGAHRYRTRLLLLMLLMVLLLLLLLVACLY